MKQNSIERQQDKISASRAETRDRVSHMFDDKERSISEEVESLISKLEPLQKAGFTFW